MALLAAGPALRAGGPAPALPLRARAAPAAHPGRIIGRPDRNSWRGMTTAGGACHPEGAAAAALNARGPMAAPEGSPGPSPHDIPTSSTLAAMLIEETEPNGRLG